MNTPSTSHRSTGWNSRWFMILVIFIGLTAASTLVVMSFTAPDQPSGGSRSEELTPMSLPVELIVATVDSTRTQAYDIHGKVQEMNEKFRGSLPPSFREGHVEAGPLLNRIIHKEDGFRITTEQGSLMATPSIAGNRLFVPGGFGSKVYYAFDLGTGKPLWTANLDDDGPSPAACSDSLIVFNTESCTIFVLHQRTGKMLWSRWLGDPLMSTPMVANDRVFTSYPNAGHAQGIDKKDPKSIAPSHPFVCFDLHKGTILWQVWLDGDVLSTAVADQGSVYLTTFPGTLYKLDQQTGTIQAAMGMQATSVPAIMGEEIFVTKRADVDSIVQESIAVLDRSTLGFLREFRARKAIYLDHEVQGKSRLKTLALAYDAGNGFADGAPAISGYAQAERNIGASNVSSLQAFTGSTIIPFDGSLYTLMGDSLFCLEPAKGDVRWSLKITADMQSEGGTAATTPIVSDAYVVTATVNGRVIVCDRRTGAVKLDLSAGGAVRYAPIMHMGKLYVPTTTGELVCLDTKDPDIHGWPMLMRSADHFCSR